MRRLMKLLRMKVLVLATATVFAAPALVSAQGGGSVGVSGSTGVMGISGSNAISGSTVQGSTSSLGNAANTAAQGLKGQNVNANLNTNQNTTGVNIGGINYTGTQGEGAQGLGAAGGDNMNSTFASPSQYIGFGNSTSVNLLQVPGFIGVPSNFSQPYKPDLWVNGPGPIVPSTLTSAQADECRASGVSTDWDGGDRPAVDSIELIWPSLGQKFPTMSSPTSYVGTSKVSSTEKYSFMATICQGAYEAMKKGATKGIVTFVIRPRNRSAGIGFGGTGGGSGLPTGVLATHPYALAGALGFGTGWARAYSEGELMMHIVALRETKGAAPKTPGSPIASAPVPQVADKPRDDAERARERATERAWFGAPASGQPNATTPRPQPVSVNGTTPVDASSSTSAPVQQVAERPPADAAVPRVPAADKAWFGGNFTR
jgi:hypothetical protein